MIAAFFASKIFPAAKIRETDIPRYPSPLQLSFLPRRRTGQAGRSGFTRLPVTSRSGSTQWPVALAPHDGPSLLSHQSLRLHAMAGRFGSRGFRSRHAPAPHDGRPLWSDRKVKRLAHPALAVADHGVRPLLCDHLADLF